MSGSVCPALEEISWDRPTHLRMKVRVSRGGGEVREVDGQRSRTIERRGGIGRARNRKEERVEREKLRRRIERAEGICSVR